jgi:L-alanine-DL-glutamate epimerase-like enolase superfamily enzyme
MRCRALSPSPAQNDAETIYFHTPSNIVVETASAPKVERLEVSAYTVPTETPEADGTLAWRDTTLVLVRVAACGVGGIGYSFADTATARLIDDHLKHEVIGRSGLHIAENWTRMVRAIRNLGRPGICSMAIAAVDNALWDLKARLLGLCVADLIGRAHVSIRAYGSGGFTSCPDDQLKRQLGDWVAHGFTSVKMKVGSTPAADARRVRAARDAIGADTRALRRRQRRLRS